MAWPFPIVLFDEPDQTTTTLTRRVSIGWRMPIKFLDLTSWIGDKVFVSDLSGIYLDPKTKRLVILSE